MEPIDLFPYFFFIAFGIFFKLFYWTLSEKKELKVGDKVFSTADAFKVGNAVDLMDEDMNVVGRFVVTDVCNHENGKITTDGYVEFVSSQ